MANARRQSDYAQKVPEELKIRHAVSRMGNVEYKGNQIELKVYNGDVSSHEVARQAHRGDRW